MWFSQLVTHSSLCLVSIATPVAPFRFVAGPASTRTGATSPLALGAKKRSEEHTSELQSRLHLVCRLLLEKKKHDVGSRHRHYGPGGVRLSAWSCSHSLTHP